MERSHACQGNDQVGETYLAQSCNVASLCWRSSVCLRSDSRKAKNLTLKACPRVVFRKTTPLARAAPAQ